MANGNLIFYVASYYDADSAGADYQSLKNAQSAEDFKVVGSVVACRDDAGEVGSPYGGDPLHFSL